MKLLLRIGLVLATTYAVLCAGLIVVMKQPPVHFGRIVKHLPMPLVWGLLPGPAIWNWARAGSLAQGDVAPDFTLPKHDRSGEVTLSSHRGDRPVVLVFGSYT
jgi:hypothetical protein